jgi:hypothetical protein
MPIGSMFDMEIGMFGKAIRFGNSFTSGLSGPVQIMRQIVSNNGQYQTSYPPYHRYKGLSSIPNLAGNREYIPDIKHSIYKHYISKHHMFDIGRYKGLADMKV